jgi:hypothetical protein
MDSYKNQSPSTRVAAPAASGTSFEALFSEAALYAPPSAAAALAKGNRRNRLIDDPMLPRAVWDPVPSPSGRVVVEDVANGSLPKRRVAAARSAGRGSI